MSTPTADHEADPRTGQSADQGDTAPTSLLRITLLSDERRADLSVPGRVPLVELMPEMLRTLGVLDATTVHAGYDLAAPDGRHLSPDAPLAGQGVRDGDSLTVVIGAEQRPPKVYDDVIEAMSDAVEEQMRPWQPEASRRTALGAAALLLLIGAGALALLRPDVVAGAAAGVVAGLLVVAAVVLSRVQQEEDAAVVLASVGCAFAAVSGYLLTSADPVEGWPAVAAGVAVAVAGLAAGVGVRQQRAVLASLGLVGILVAGAATVVAASSFAPGQVAAVTLVLVVAGGLVVPRLALESTSTRVPQAYTHDDLVREPEPVDGERVGGDARRAHALLLGLSVTSGLLVLLLTPYVVELGVSGTVLVLCAVAVLALRTRQFRVDSEVAAAFGLAVATVSATALSALVQHPEWRPALGLVGAGVGVVLLLVTLLPLEDSVRRGRLAEITEIAALVAMIPLVVFAAGVVQSVA